MEIFEMKAQLRDKVNARDILNLEILHLQEKIRAMHKRYLTVVLAEERKRHSSSGLTDAIRNILQKHENPMTASEVRLGLEALRFPLKRFKNSSSAVKATLIRLSKAGELRHDEKENSYDLTKRL